jgi:hypothetical protein
MGHLHIEGRKMSKSLKNFITVQQYLSSNITSAPADDFRLYCMQHKYHSALTYSPARVQEAARFRSKTEHFFSLCALVRVHRQRARGGGGGGDSVSAAEGSAVVCEGVVGKKPTLQSRQLSSALLRVQGEVHIALGDDFDTVRALNSIGDLLGEGTRFAEAVYKETGGVGVGEAGGAGEAGVWEAGEAGAGPQHPVESLFAVSEYVSGLLTTLGLQFPDKFKASEVEGGGGVGSESVDRILHFRSQVRASALAGLKALKKGKKEGLTELEQQLELHFADLIAACDHGRDALEAALHIKIDDLGAMSKWTKRDVP